MSFQEYVDKLKELAKQMDADGMTFILGLRQAKRTFIESGGSVDDAAVILFHAQVQTVKQCIDL